MSKLKIDSVHCKACGLCVRACPKQVLRLGERINAAGYNYVVLENEEQCVSCACCALNCPDMAINVYKEARA